MSEPTRPVPTWSGWGLRVLIYVSVAAIAYWWSPMLCAFFVVFMSLDLIHQAADTARRRSGYRPIPSHPVKTDRGSRRLKMTGRALILIFAMIWFVAAVLGHLVLDSSWFEAATQAFALAAFGGIAAAMMFPIAASALLFVVNVPLGLILSLADIGVSTFAAPHKRHSLHRRIDGADHRLADWLLGQLTHTPLRASLVERAADEVLTQERPTH